MDFSYLRTHVPVIDTIMQSMLAVGWALLIGNLVFQAAKSMLSGLGFEGEDPKLLFTRTFVFSFLLLASPQICEMCLDMTATVIDVMELPNAVSITLATESAFSGLTCAWLLVIICGIIVMFQSFKLIFEMAERYFILAVLTICAPLAFGTGGSKNTSDIFSGWCRMYGSMCLLMVLNVVFVKMLLSALAYVPSGLDVLPWMVLIISIVKVAKKSDSIITRIGLNPAMTGDPLGSRLPGMLTYAVARTAVSQVTKSIGGNGGNDRRYSANTTTNNSGGPKTGNPVGGRNKTTTGGTASENSYHQQQSGGQATTQQNSTQQSAAQQGTAQQSTSRQSTVQTGTGPQNTPRPGNTQASATQFGTKSADAVAQGSGASVSASTQVNQNSSLSGQASQTRKSSVPPGTRRSPAHAKIISTATTTARETVSRSVAPAGTNAQSGNPLQTDHLQHSTAGTPQGSTVVGKTQRAQSDAAGTASQSTRFTHVASHTSLAGAPGSHTHSDEQSGMTVDASHTAAPAAASAQRTSSGAAHQSTSHTESGTRSTQRPPVDSQPQAQVDTSTSQTTPQHQTQNLGTAGMSASYSERRTSQASRSSRKDTSPSTAVSPVRQRSDTAQQEQRRPAKATTPGIKGSVSSVHPGPAGTVSTGQRSPSASKGSEELRTHKKSSVKSPKNSGGPNHG